MDNTAIQAAIKKMTDQGAPPDAITAFLKSKGVNASTGKPSTTPTTDKVFGASTSTKDFIAEQGSFKDEKAATTAEAAAGTKTKVGAALEGAFSGKPLFPVTEDTQKDTENSFLGVFKDIGRGIGNLASDTPAVIKGFKDLIAHPIDSAKGIVSYYAGAAKEGLAAISATTESIVQAVKSGDSSKVDFSRLQSDIEKLHVLLVDHPVSTILAFDGAKGAIESASELPGKVRDVTTKVSDTYNEGSKSSIYNKTKEVQGVLDQKIEAQKKVADAQAKLSSFTDKPKADVAAKEGEIVKKTEEQAKTKEEQAANLAEQHKAQNELRLAQEDLKSIEKAHTDLVNKTASDAQGELKSKGFDSLNNMQSGVKELYQKAKDTLGKVYEENLGNAKVAMDGVFSGVKKFQDYLRGISDTKTLKAVQPMVDNLKIRQLVTEVGGDDKKFNDAIANASLTSGARGIKGASSPLEGIDPKTLRDLRDMTKEQIADQYPPLTSENIKGTRNNLESTIRENNTDALKNFSTNVKTAFKDAFRDAITAHYGEETTAKLDQADKSWSDLEKNPLFQKENPTLKDIQSNWSSFTRDANRLPQGQALIEKIQNYAAEQILNKAETNGKYNATAITKGLKDFGTILGDDQKSNLQSIVDLHDQNPEATAKTQQIEETKGKQQDLAQEKQSLNETQKNLAEQKKGLADEQKKIQSDLKDIGSTPQEVLQKIESIGSKEELDSFLQKTGKTIEDVRAVTMQSILEDMNKEFGKTPMELVPENGLLKLKEAPFPLDKVGDFVERVKSIGGNGPEAAEVNRQILGDEGVKAIDDLEKKNQEYENLTSKEAKARGNRIVQAAVGGVLTAMGHIFLGPHMVLKALKPEEIETGGRGRLQEKPSKAKQAVTAARDAAGRFSVKKAAILGSANARGKKQDDTTQ